VFYSESFWDFWDGSYDSRNTFSKPKCSHPFVNSKNDNNNYGIILHEVNSCAQSGESLGRGESHHSKLTSSSIAGESLHLWRMTPATHAARKVLKKASIWACYLQAWPPEGLPGNWIQGCFIKYKVAAQVLQMRGLRRERRPGFGGGVKTRGPRGLSLGHWATLFHLFPFLPPVAPLAARVRIFTFNACFN